MAQQYTVKSGDSLSKIGRQFGVDWKKITGFKSGNPNLIHPGEVLTLPGGTPVTKSVPAPPVPVMGGQKPKMAGEVQSYLEDWQTRIKNVKGSQAFTPFVPGAQKESGRAVGPFVPGKKSDRFMQPGGQQAWDPISGTMGALGDLAIPEAPSMVDTFGELRDEYGLADMEAGLNTLKAEQEETEAIMRQRKTSEEGKRVGLGVIAGRVSEVERQEMDRLDFIGRQISRKTDQINSAYNVIGMVMDLTQTDYNNAMTTYQAQFGQIMAVHDAMVQERAFQYGVYKDEREFEQHLIERDQDMAMANLQIYTEMITSGSMDWGGMSETVKTEIHKLEIKSGLGFGFVSGLKMPPGSNIKSVTKRQDQSGMEWADVIYVNPDGSISVESKQLGQGYVTPRAASGGGRGTAGERDSRKAQNFVKGVNTKGSAEREATIGAIQKFDVDRAGPKTEITEANAQAAARYLMSAEGLDAQSAAVAVEMILRAHHYTGWE